MLHSFLLDCREPVIRFTERCQTDFQPGQTHAHETINQQQTQSIVTKGSSQVSSTFVVYKFLVFSEILARNCALVFLEHHESTQHG
jgi:hypothetical protein